MKGKGQWQESDYERKRTKTEKGIRQEKDYDRKKSRTGK